MPELHYHIVEHDGGWAYKLGDVFSETFRTHDAALRAAKSAAREQELPGQTEAIEYQDANGRWHVELAKGDDHPHAEVDDD
ncbi:MAG TPA: DUF2188 domain-containing protein [Devosiaceae bacterium]|jgi:hypothetical protein